MKGMLVYPGPDGSSRADEPLDHPFWRCEGSLRLLWGLAESARMSPTALVGWGEPQAGSRPCVHYRAPLQGLLSDRGARLNLILLQASQNVVNKLFWLLWYEILAFTGIILYIRVPMRIHENVGRTHVPMTCRT